MPLPQDILRQILEPLLVESITGQYTASAIPNGTLIRKCNSIPENPVKDGELGLVIGSVPGNEKIIVEERRVYIIYAVEWKNGLGVSLVADFRLEPVEDPSEHYEF